MGVYKLDGIHIDTEDPSFARVVYGKWTDEAFDAHLEILRKRVVENELPVVVLTDLSNAKIPNARERQLSIDFWKQANPHVRGRMVAIAYVATNPMVRAALEIFRWFEGPPAPLRIFGSVAKAELWLQVNLEQRFDEIERERMAAGRAAQGAPGL